MLSHWRLATPCLQHQLPGWAVHKIARVGFLRIHVRAATIRALAGGVGCRMSPQITMYVGTCWLERQTVGYLATSYSLSVVKALTCTISKGQRQGIRSLLRGRR